MNTITPESVTSLAADAAQQARFLAEDLGVRAKALAASAAAIADLPGLPPGVQTAATRIMHMLKSEALQIEQQLARTSKAKRAA